MAEVMEAKRDGPVALRDHSGYQPRLQKPPDQTVPVRSIYFEGNRSPARARAKCLANEGAS